jgi:hypothetical protein
MTQTNAVIGVFDAHENAEGAIRELQKAGFDISKLSIVGKDYHTEEQVRGFYTTGDRVKFWGKLGAFWGGIWGLLLGAAFFLVPGIGPVVVAGPLVAAIVGGLEGAVVVGGLSAIGAALVSMGIPKDSVLKMEVALKADKFLVVVHGASAEVEKARAILSTQGATDLVTNVAQPASAR